MRTIIIIAAMLMAGAAHAQVQQGQSDYQPVQQITCPGGINSSAVVISADRVIGAEHGFAAEGCGTKPVWYDREYDLYIGEVSTTVRPATISCDTIVAGETYRLVGYERTVVGRAQPRYRSVESETGVHDNMVAIEGGAQVGMSGGAVLNQDNKLVGIISSTNGEVTYVREFATTSLCAA